MMTTLGRCGGGSEADVMFSMSPLGPKRHFAAPKSNVAIGVTTDINRHGTEGIGRE